MSFTTAVDVLAERVSDLSTGDLEVLARLVPLTGHTPEEGMVGAALERVLRARYAPAVGGRSDAEVFAWGVGGDFYGSRVDRARSDVAQRLLEERHPDAGEPIDTYPHDPAADVPEGTWAAHIRHHYSITTEES